MTIPEPWSADGPKLGEDLAERPTTSAARLAQPWRLAVVAAELLVLVALVLAAWWCWGRAHLDVSVTGGSGPAPATRLAGNWAALSIAAATTAGLLLLDGIRQLMLAWRVRRSRG